ncbi:MAG: hypothetical protein JNN30_15450 [Rhodanobacteraceae bacterium]|nr:hypothetical protein [Rhodanobacteraceae bacterium]
MRVALTKWGCFAGSVLIVVAAGASGSAYAKERDNAMARRQAMDEWYNESYDQRSKRTKIDKNKKQLWTTSYQHFMLQAAQRERQRYSRLLPGSDTSATVIDPKAAAKINLSGTWNNIGPTAASYAQNGGTTLNGVSDTGRVRSIVTDPNNAQTIYVAFAGGGVWKSTDGGAFWNAKTETLGSLSVGALEMDPNNANVLYLGLGDPFDGTGIGLAKSTDGANTWSNPVVLGDSTIIPDIAVSPSNSNLVLVATNKGLYRSTNAGASYAPVSINTGVAETPYIWSIDWGGGNTFVLSLEAAPSATATNGQVWRSTDSGATWTRATGIADSAGIGRVTVAAAPSDRTTMYALAANTSGTENDFANLFKSTDNGVTWTGVGASKKGTRVTYKSYSNRNTESTTLQTVFSGQGSYDQMLIVRPTNKNEVYFGGALLIAKTTDGGSTYSQASNWLAQFGLPYVHADLHTAHYDRNGTLYVGSDGGVFFTANGGTTWSAAMNEGIATHLVYQIGSSTADRGKVIAGLQDNGTRVRVGSTGVYNQEIGGDGFGCDVNQSNANQMLGSLYYARIMKSTDSGLNFSSACSGITECNNDATAPFLTVIKRWDGDLSGNTLYTYSYTKAYKSVNYAGSWSPLGTTGLPTTSLYIRGIGTARSNASVIGLVANSGRVFLSSNGGTSWTAPSALPNHDSSLSSIAFDTANTNIIYVSSVAPNATKTHLWRSSNGGASWSPIDGGGFPTGIPVNAVSVDPTTSTTLYAATHLGAYTSTDSGTTWSRLGAGMPLVNVTDLYVSRDGTLVRAATFGRSVWELAQ